MGPKIISLLGGFPFLLCPLEQSPTVFLFLSLGSVRMHDVSDDIFIVLNDEFNKYCIIRYTSKFASNWQQP